MPDFGELTGPGVGNGGSSQLPDDGDASVGGAQSGGSGGGSGAGGGASGTGGSGSCGGGFAGDTLFTFDTSLAGGLSGIWSEYPEGSPALSETRVSWVATEGMRCPGSLSMTVPFDTYGEQKVMATINFTANWSTPAPYSVLHAWVKLALPPEASTLEHLRGVQVSVSSGANYEAFRSFFLASPSFADGGWHELVVTLEPVMPPPQLGSYVPESVRQIGVQVVAALAAPASGPPAPVSTTIFVDDIWLERD